MLLFLLAQTTAQTQPEPQSAIQAFSKLHVEQVVAWSKGSDPSVQRTLHCAEALPSCLAHEVGKGRLFRQADQGSYVMEAGRDRVRVITFREPIEPSPNGFLWTAQERVRIEVLSDQILEMPTPELDLDGPALRGAWDEEISHPDYLIAVQNSKRISTHRPFEQAPFVVCAESVVQQPLVLRSVGMRKAGFNEEGFQTVYEYELPCKAELLIGGALPFIEVGPREPSPYGTPPRAPPTSEVDFQSTLGVLTISATSVIQEERSTLSGVGGCQIEVKGLEIQSSNYCHVQFIGDVNADGRDDYVFDHIGEMGCGWRELWTTENGGLRRVGKNSWDC